MTIPLLSRAWQMLVKGYEEAGRSPDAFAAAEMVLIRMAYTADLPTPDDLIRNASVGVGAQNGTSLSGPGGSATPTQPEHPQASNDAEPILSTFSAMVDYVGSKRDVGLKLELEEHVRPVHFEPGQIEIELLSGAKKTLAGDLKRKLDAWTGMTWTIAVSSDGGGQTIREEREAHRESELDLVRGAPLLKAALEAFPGAEITDVRPLSDSEPDDTKDDKDSRGGAA